jgi:pimeloyl-ACP methyl ester carboxylesterase
LRRQFLNLIGAGLIAAAGSGAALAAKAADIDLVIQGASGPLGGAFAEPAGGADASKPLVVIIPGSGPVDRDGDTPAGFVKAVTYRLLAQALADRGVASVRIDKRGLYASDGAGDPNKVTIGAYAADVHGWAAAMRKRVGVPCVWLLGHSEGGLVALVAAQAPADICGVVLAEAAGRPLGDVIADQLKANPANAPVLAEALAALARLEAGQPVDATGMSPALLPLFRPAVQDFAMDEMRYDPAKLVAAFPGPVLVVQGTTDIQVSEGDAKRLADARPGVRLVTIAGMNHVLKEAPADRAGNIATYADPDLPLAPGVADAVAGFVKSDGKSP